MPMSFALAMSDRNYGFWKAGRNGLGRDLDIYVRLYRCMHVRARRFKLVQLSIESQLEVFKVNLVDDEEVCLRARLGRWLWTRGVNGSVVLSRNHSYGHKMNRRIMSG